MLLPAKLCRYEETNSHPEIPSTKSVFYVIQLNPENTTTTTFKSTKNLSYNIPEDTVQMKIILKLVVTEATANTIPAPAHPSIAHTLPPILSLMKPASGPEGLHQMKS